MNILYTTFNASLKNPAFILITCRDIKIIQASKEMLLIDESERNMK
jgi:hypothetical protein